MYILISKSDNKIKSKSSEPIEFDKTIFKLKEVPDEDLDGQECFYKGNKIEKKKIGKDKDDMKERIKNANSIGGIKDILIDMLK